MKEYLSKGFRYFLYLFGCLWLTLFVCVATTFLYRFLVKNNPIGEYIIQIINMTITMSIALFMCTYRRGYTDREFKLKMILIPMGIALILQLIYAAVFSFSMYTSGPAFYAGKVYYLLHGGAELRVPSEFVFPFMLVFDIPYIAIAIAGEYVGVKKRSIDREKLISGDNK